VLQSEFFPKETNDESIPRKQDNAKGLAQERVRGYRHDLRSTEDTTFPSYRRLLTAITKKKAEEEVNGDAKLSFAHEKKLFFLLGRENSFFRSVTRALSCEKRERKEFIACYGLSQCGPEKGIIIRMRHKTPDCSGLEANEASFKLKDHHCRWP
jgi:hypothetical protein